MMVVSNLKKQLSITALTFSALLALTNPVNAGEYKVGDVLYCESESGAFVQNPDYKFNKWKPFTFKFKIKSEQEIKFGSGGYFNNKKFNLEFWTDVDGDGILDLPLVAKSYARRFILHMGRFTYARADSLDASMMTGTCDKF